MILTLSILSIVIGIIFISGFLTFYLLDEDIGGIIIFIGLVFAFIIGVFGWGTWASWGYDTMIVNKIQPEIVKTKTTAYAEFKYEFNGHTSSKTIEYTKYIDYISVDSCQFYIIKYFNYYDNEESFKISKDKKYGNYELGKKIDVNNE